MLGFIPSSPSSCVSSFSSSRLLSRSSWSQERILHVIVLPLNVSTIQLARTPLLISLNFSHKKEIHWMSTKRSNEMGCIVLAKRVGQVCGVPRHTKAVFIPETTVQASSVSKSSLVITSLPCLDSRPFLPALFRAMHSCTHPRYSILSLSCKFF